MPRVKVKTVGTSFPWSQDIAPALSISAASPPLPPLSLHLPRPLISLISPHCALRETGDEDENAMSVRGCWAQAARCPWPGAGAVTRSWAASTIAINNQLSLCLKSLHVIEMYTHIAIAKVKSNFKHSYNDLSCDFCSGNVEMTQTTNSSSRGVQGDWV